MTKKEKILRIKEIFDDLYLNAKCSLDYGKPYELLIATILSAQCTDVRVNIVTKDLFKKYTSISAFANADYTELCSDIKSTGFYKNKAKNIIACCTRIIDVYKGEVPKTLEALTTLAGVGRKTAGVVLGDVFDTPSLVIDTHAKRLAKRIGLTKHIDPFKVEMDLEKIVPKYYRSIFCHQLVYHGRAVCDARKPKCDICQINDICDKKIK